MTGGPHRPRRPVPATAPTRTAAEAAAAAAEVPTGAAGGAGIVLFAHGARDPRWAETILALADRIGALAPGLPVEPAYLELMEPDLAEAVARLVGRGVGTVVVVPVFLSAGGHVLRDLPAQLARLEPRHPGVRFRVEAALGSQPSVIDAMARVCLATTIG